MDTRPVEGQRHQAEPLAALSIKHLSDATRVKLAEDELSVNAYPTECRGFVFVGKPRYRVPAETDLATIFEAAEQAGIVWLMFDLDAAAIDGLPVFDGEAPR